jgi:hypothetical protein
MVPFTFLQLCPEGGMVKEEQKFDISFEEHGADVEVR